MAIRPFTRTKQESPQVPNTPEPRPAPEQAPARPGGIPSVITIDVVRLGNRYLARRLGPDGIYQPLHEPDHRAIAFEYAEAEIRNAYLAESFVDGNRG